MSAASSITRVPFRRRPLDIEHVVGPVVKHASRHGAPEITPVVGALLLRNYEIKGLSDRWACAVAEDVLGGLVPIANDPLAVRRNDRMGARRERDLRDGLLAASPRCARMSTCRPHAPGQFTWNRT
jgi:hypothetical protein